MEFVDPIRLLYLLFRHTVLEFLRAVVTILRADSLRVCELWESALFINSISPTLKLKMNKTPKKTRCVFVYLQAVVAGNNWTLNFTMNDSKFKVF